MCIFPNPVYAKKKRILLSIVIGNTYIPAEELEQLPPLVDGKETDKTMENIPDVYKEKKRNRKKEPP